MARLQEKGVEYPTKKTTTKKQQQKKQSKKANKQQQTKNKTKNNMGHSPFKTYVSSNLENPNIGSPTHLDRPSANATTQPLTIKAIQYIMERVKAGEGRGRPT